MGVVLMKVANGQISADQLAARESVAKVWIDPDLCTGDGLCTDIVPEIFYMTDDGIAAVKEGVEELGHPEGQPEPLANVPSKYREASIEAAEECPGECIFLTTQDGAPLILSDFGI